MYKKNDGTEKYLNKILKFRNTYIGPHSYLKDEAEYIRSVNWNYIKIEVIGTTIGAKVIGIDPTKEVPTEQINELKKAISIYKVIVIDNFELSPKQHINFSKSLGDIFTHPFLPSSGEESLISFIRNKKNGGYENVWHSDLTWTENPGMYAILNCRTIPRYGGDTLFADMYSAYDVLDVGIKNRLEGLTACHDFVLSFKPFFSKEEIDKMEKIYKKVNHPIFPTHPITNKKFVYVNKNFTSKINGIDEKESSKLIEHLCSLASIPEVQYRHKWTYPQMVIWDNYSVQHYAVSDYWPYNRHVDRATVMGPKFS